MKESIKGKQILNKTVDNAYFHVAFVGERTGTMEASCVTFHDKHRVPPGSKYGVIS